MFDKNWTLDPKMAPVPSNKNCWSGGSSRLPSFGFYSLVTWTLNMRIRVSHTGLGREFLLGQQTSHCDDVKDFEITFLGSRKFDKHLIAMDQLFMVESVLIDLVCSLRCPVNTHSSFWAAGIFFLSVHGAKLEARLSCGDVSRSYYTFMFSPLLCDGRCHPMKNITVFIFEGTNLGNCSPLPILETSYD